MTHRHHELFRRVGFGLFTVAAVSGAVIATQRVDHTVNGAKHLSTEVERASCERAMTTRSAVLFWMHRHGGVDEMDAAEFERLGFRVLPCTG